MVAIVTFGCLSEPVRPTSAANYINLLVGAALDEKSCSPGLSKPLTSVFV